VTRLGKAAGVHACYMNGLIEFAKAGERRLAWACCWRRKREVMVSWAINASLSLFLFFLLFFPLIFLLSGLSLSVPCIRPLRSPFVLSVFSFFFVPSFSLSLLVSLLLVLRRDDCNRGRGETAAFAHDGCCSSY